MSRRRAVIADRVFVSLAADQAEFVAAEVERRRRVSLGACKSDVVRDALEAYRAGLEAAPGSLSKG